MKCNVCGNNKKFIEVLSGGIKQLITYDDGHIIEEQTTYDKENKNNRLICMNCGQIFSNYEI